MSTLMRNLKTAIFFGDVKKVRKLLKSLAPIPLCKNPLIFGGYSLLKLAIKLRNRKDIVKLLIKKGARVNKKYCDKSVPLLNIAIRQQHVDIVKLLVKKGANVNELDRHKRTPMFVTIGLSQKLSTKAPTIDIMKFFIRNGADIQAKNGQGCTALELCCTLEQFKMAKLFIKLNDIVNSPTIFDSNPISIAVLFNSWKIASLLLKYNAWANSTIDEMTICECSLWYLDLPDERLYSLGKNPTLLHAAIVCDDVEMVKLLINHGADIHYRTKSFKRTPLMLAIEENSPEIVDLLLKKGARINECDANGVLPLYYIICNPNNVGSRLNVDIIERNHQPKLKILMSMINAGANIIETSESVGTKLKFLRMAITYGEHHIVRYLVESAEFDMLVDEEIRQTAKLNTTLLSRQQLGDQGFMVKLKKVFKLIEFLLLCGIMRRHRSVKEIDEQWKRNILSKPVNVFWHLSQYKELVKLIDYKMYQRIEKMKEYKIGNSTISLYHLWTASWNQLINYAYNKDVREFYSGNYTEGYRLFMPMIRKRVNVAIKRSKLLEKSSEIIFVLLKTLPFSCCQNIATYLDDDELEIFNTQFKDIDE